MTSMRSWLNPAIIKENFKRFWPVAAVGFCIWFLCMPFILLMSEEYYSGTVTGMMNHMNPATFTMDLALPIGMAMLCFGYLHRPNSAGVMHSMPCTRLSLYVSSWISGYVLAVIPVIMTGIMLLIIRKPVIQFGQDIFSPGVIFKWLGEELIISLFIYSIAVFAGMVAGNTVLHGLTALAFNFLVPAIYLIFMMFGDIYLYGIEFSDMTGPLKNMSPYIMVIAQQHIPSKDCLIFVLIAAAAVLAGYLLYRIRPLERAGDSYVFKAATWIIGALIVFIFGCVSGFLFHYDFEIGGYVIGILIGWGAGQMIVNKTTRIFRKDCFAVGLAGIIAIAAVIGCFKADILGYETYVPDASDIEKISFDCSRLNFNLTKENRWFTEESDFENITAFHKELVKNVDVLKEGAGYDYDGEVCYVNFSYQLKNGRKVSRYMNAIPIKYLKESPALEQLWNENSRRASYDWILNAPIEDIYVEMDYFDSENPHWVNLDYGYANAELKDKIRQAVAEDLGESSFDAIMNAWGTRGYVRLQVRTLVPEGEGPDYPEYYSEGYYEYFEPVEVDGPALSSRYLIKSMYCEYSDSYANLMKLVPEIENYSEDRFIEKY